MPELTAWDSFYVIVGSAAGALIGLQFVVVTLIAERPRLRVEEAGAAFATPTIVHFSAALLLFRVDGRQARNNLCAITSSRQNVERGTRNVEFRSSEERQQEKQSLAAGGPKRVSRIADLLGESAHMRDLDAAERRDFLRTGLFAAGTALWSGTFFQTFASADEKRSPAEANTISRRELLKGLDGMSRVAEKGNDPFFGGHNAAAVMAAAFFAREEKLDERTQKEIRSLIEARLLTSPIYAPRPNETADPEIGKNLVMDLD